MYLAHNAPNEVEDHKGYRCHLVFTFWGLPSTFAAGSESIADSLALTIPRHWATWDASPRLNTPRWVAMFKASSITSISFILLILLGLAPLFLLYALVSELFEESIHGLFLQLPGPETLDEVGSVSLANDPHIKFMFGDYFLDTVFFSLCHNFLKNPPQQPKGGIDKLT